MNKRFSKATVLEYIEQRATKLQMEHRLDPHNGWAQVEYRDTEAAVAYGEFRGLLDLRDAIEEGDL
jgi:hypothetical protein